MKMIRAALAVPLAASLLLGACSAGTVQADAPRVLAESAASAEMEEAPDMSQQKTPEIATFGAGFGGCE